MLFYSKRGKIQQLVQIKLCYNTEMHLQVRSVKVKQKLVDIGILMSFAPPFPPTHTAVMTPSGFEL